MDFKEDYLHSLLGNQHYNKLLNFYLPFFPNRSTCITYLYRILHYEPLHTLGFYKNDLCALDTNGNPIEDDVFIPKRMLNTVQRFVSVAKDMDRIRPGDDPFKIIFLITCIESLQTQKGSRLSKRKMIENFFESFTNDDDLEYIQNNFEMVSGTFHKMSRSGTSVLANALYAIRNSAVHSGDYWNLIFPENNRCLLITVPNKEQNKPTLYTNSITYEKFEVIFVRTCMNLIDHYVSEKYGT